MANFDLVIRGGTIADGTGKAPFVADIAISEGRIAAVGKVTGQGREEIDAAGLLVTPGFVDIHTHYDAQVTWEQTLRPSSDHGVTTAVMGNCGVGFAPCRPEDRAKLTKLMEGVEDIPEPVMVEGIPWSWESYPDYLNWLSKREYDIDFGSLIPHAPVRVNVMGQRGTDREPATAADMAAMAELVREGLEAGALGFSTSRSLLHRTKAGVLSPIVTAAEEELAAIALAMKGAGRGIYQMIDDFQDTADGRSTEFDLLQRLAATSERPVHFTLLQRVDQPNHWKTLVDRLDQANAEGVTMVGQVFPRVMGGLLGFDMPYNPFSSNPTYLSLASLSPEERLEALKTPAVRERLLQEEPVAGGNAMVTGFTRNVSGMFSLGSPPNYMPKPGETVGEIAKAKGVSPFEVAYDILLENEGRQKLFMPTANTSDATYQLIRNFIDNENTVPGLGDGGAHYGILCDASYTTHMLTYWTRDRDQPGKLAIETAVKRITHDPARSVGLHDRGVVAPGYKADLNVIDYDNLCLLDPQPVNDLPAGGWRVRQKAQGYRATIVNGVATYIDGVSTGALPGRLVRGEKASPEERI